MQQQDTHAQVWAQLPWLVNGTASHTQRQQAEHHLQGCADCQQELSRQHALAQALNAAPCGLVGDADKGWAQLAQRLPVPQPPRARSSWASGSSRRLSRWLGGLVAIEAVAVAALAMVILRPAVLSPPEDSFATLSSPGTIASGVRWRVLPDPTQPLSQWQSSLAAHQLQVLGGPSSAGVWSLGWMGTQPPDVEAVAQSLRARPGVRFVEVIPHAQ